MKVCHLICLVSVAVLCLTGCGSSQASSRVAEAFQRQSSVTCSLRYDITLYADAAGGAVESEQSYTADGQIDLGNGTSHLFGELENSTDGTVTGREELECYAESTDTDSDAPVYCRFGELYYAESLSSSFLSTLLLPLSLSLSDYTLTESAEILSGSVCDVYTGFEIADDSAQVFLSGTETGVASLAGCSASVTLWAAHDTSLPVRLVCDYVNLNELGISFVAEGVTYFITSLRWEVDYTNYGAAVDTAVADGFRELALQDDGNPTPLAEIPGSVVIIDGDDYTIRNDRQTYGITVTRPEFMATKEVGEDSVLFYYFYAVDDYETVCCTLLSGYTVEEEEAYALSQGEYYAASDGVEAVKTEDVAETTVGEWDVRYVITTFTLAQDGTLWDVIEICSWVPVGYDADCLEVRITEYNASGDGEQIDPKAELDCVYACIAAAES